MNADPVHDLRAMKLDGLGADAGTGRPPVVLPAATRRRISVCRGVRPGVIGPSLSLISESLDARRQVTTAGKDGAEGKTQLVQDEIGADNLKPRLPALARSSRAGRWQTG